MILVYAHVFNAKKLPTEFVYYRAKLKGFPAWPGKVRQQLLNFVFDYFIFL